LSQNGTLFEKVRDNFIADPEFFAIFVPTMSGTFKDLKCYQRAVDLALLIYETTRAFPKEELFGLTAQLRRAAVSIISNIAEGKGRSTEKDLIRFLVIARGSLFEVEAQIALAERLCYINPRQAARVLAQASETGKLINGLIRAFDSACSAA
jgi:four helix bundle protein